MADAVVHSCSHCGKTEGMRDKKGRPRKFCSKECWSASIAAGRDPCKRCGSTNKQADRLYCSLECKEADALDAAQAKPKVPCAHCGTPVEANFSKNRAGEESDKKFCNRSCYDAYRSNVIDQRRMVCPHCGVSFIPIHKRRVYCSESCWLNKKKATPKNCVNCNCFFTPVKLVKKASGIRFISYNSAKTCSRECHIAWITNNEERKKKISEAFKGANHPAWLGGKTWRSNASYRGPNWNEIAEKARKRDGYKCQECGMTQDEHIQKYGIAINVHHIEPFHNFPNSRLANKMSNLVTLCRPHHSKAEAQIPSVQMTLPLADNRHGLRPGHMKGERHYAAKFTRDQIVDIRHNMGNMTSSEIARKFGVSVTTIQGIRSRRTWKSV